MIRLSGEIEALVLTEDQATKIRYQLLEFIPARRCIVHRGPGIVIEVAGREPDELAPGILRRIEQIAECTFRVESAPDGSSKA
ncbi:MAG TPA: hypothetical protein VGL05_18905 [Kribbella sp.]